MFNHLRTGVSLLVLFTVLTGLAYPLAITGIAKTVMPGQAQGSPVEKDGTIVGSSLIGQNFATDRYFWPRPSATGDAPYNAAASTGTNLGTTSEKLKQAVKAEIERQHKAGIAGAIPADAATSSGSGLDPHISPAYALAQADRVAKARNLPTDRIKVLVNEHIDGRLFGVIGEPRVNVLALNMALDSLRP
ncbi:MAG: K+-transporting ATPase subunit [Rhizobium sp.]|nr:K+-transporting ATPase subunit [Rhizobium sp.]